MFVPKFSTPPPIHSPIPVEVLVVRPVELPLVALVGRPVVLLEGPLVVLAPPVVLVKRPVVLDPLKIL
jgi:hypothetical protein